MREGRRRGNGRGTGTLGRPSAAGWLGGTLRGGSGAALGVARAEVRMWEQEGSAAAPVRTGGAQAEAAPHTCPGGQSHMWLTEPASHRRVPTTCRAPGEGFRTPPVQEERPHCRGRHSEMRQAPRGSPARDGTSWRRQATGLYPKTPRSKPTLVSGSGGHGPVVPGGCSGTASPTPANPRAAHTVEGGPRTRQGLVCWPALQSALQSAVMEERLALSPLSPLQGLNCGG